ncbi:MAG: hypothetical protein RR087_11630, partial [Oscillospiraceae bacterium]
VSGNVALTANGLQLNGTMVQILEFAAGTSTAASVGMYSGTANATYNNNNKTFTLTSSGGVIGWAKLEKGGVTTPYVPKGYGVESLECQRYFYKTNNNRYCFTVGEGNVAKIENVVYPISMRIVPTVTITFHNGQRYDILQNANRGFVLQMLGATTAEFLVFQFYASADL